MEYQITIPFRYLQAVRLFVAKNDIKRRYLQGVLLRQGSVMATDTYWAGKVTLSGVDTSLPEIIIPAETIDFYAKKVGRYTVKDVTIIWDDEGNLRLENDAGIVEMSKVLPGRYPDLSRLIPEDAPATGNPQIVWSRLAQFEKAAVALGVPKRSEFKVMLTPLGDGNPARVTIPGQPEFGGVITTLRPDYVAKVMAGI